jgi:tRNA modification GTPase
MYNDTIVALATPAGAGAIAIIRLSGPKAISIADSVFDSVSGKSLLNQATHTIHLGQLRDDARTLDQVLVSVFKNPTSYTGEDVAEFSCHGSPFIQQEIIKLLLTKGARMAKPGEFTLRAFTNGKMDLSQAEAVADLIASDSAAAHQVAIQQMRGGFTNQIAKFRQELLDFASLIELELDFAEEDVAFADRAAFEKLIVELQEVLKKLIDSFAIGNVIKNGIPVAIVGQPNVGKSTLLNALLNEERAIVSPVAGTTRDTIEDELSIGGLNFRFIDTAGIRETVDSVESIGIKKTFEKIEQAQVVIVMQEAQRIWDQKDTYKQDVAKLVHKNPLKPMLLVANKADLIATNQAQSLDSFIQEVALAHPKCRTLLLSAKTGMGVQNLQDSLLEFVNTGALKNDQSIVTNSRHYDALTKALEEIIKVRQGINANLSGDLLAIDLRQALYHLGEITGEITNDELLGNIFANFCIGK